VGFTTAVFAGRSHIGEDRLTSVYFFNSVDLTHGPLQVSISLPLIRQETMSFDPTRSGTRSGLGDPLVRVDARVLNYDDGRLQVRLTGAWKPSLVDSTDGLGSGETDVAAGASVFAAVGRTTLFADAMYWKFGDPVGVDFTDAVSYSVGAGRMLGGGRWSTLLSLSGFSNGIGDATPPLQLGVAVLAVTGRRQSAAISAGVNLTDHAGDLTVGISWRIVR
jgi:hypothetical protein